MGKQGWRVCAKMLRFFTGKAQILIYPDASQFVGTARYLQLIQKRNIFLRIAIVYLQ